MLRCKWYYHYQKGDLKQIRQIGLRPVGNSDAARRFDVRSGPLPSARPRYNISMPITVFDVRGVPGSRRERIETAVVAGGRHAAGPHEAWIAADPFKGGFRVLVTGPHGFERTVVFAIDDDPAVIAERARETMEG